jgi:endonuclease III
MTREEVRHYLLSLSGIGEKIARCVMLYSLRFDVSPVDSHVLRVLKRVGLFPESADTDESHHILDNLIPHGLSYRLHVNLVAHGRDLCKPSKPNCEECVIINRCYFDSKKRLIDFISI